MNKIHFDVNDVQLVSENIDSSFAILSIDFFASGDNRHHLFVSEESLMKNAHTIKNVPLVWKYDSRLDDIYTHDPDEVPCGFIPESAIIKDSRLPDGRVMLSVIAYVWKKYSKNILDFFKRDGDKPVSVEMSVFETEKKGDIEELKDFKFEAITILGSFVTPAVPLAKATVLQFAEEYKEIVKLEFGRYGELNFKIPHAVKSNAEDGLTLYKQHGRGGTGKNLAVATHLMKNDITNPEKIRNIAKYFSRHANDNLDDKTSDGWIAWQLRGGSAGRTWSMKLLKKITEIDNQEMAYFDNNSIIADNNFAKEELSVKDEEQKVDNKTSEEKEKEEFQEVVEEKEKEKEKEEFQESQPEEKPEEKGEVEEKKEEKEEGQEKEQEKEEEKEEMSLDQYLDVSALLTVLQNETDSNEELVRAGSKPVDDAHGKMMGTMFAKMRLLVAEKEDLSLKLTAFASELESLKEFKAEKELEQFTFAVNFTLKEIEEKTKISTEKLEELREKAKEFSMADIDAWRNYAKATALDFAIENTKSDYERYALPNNSEKQKSYNSVWHRE